MAALFLVQSDDLERAEAALKAARAQFALHGFPECTETSVPGWRLLHAPHIIGGSESFLADGEDFVGVAGTFTYDGTMGRPALEALLRTISLPSPDWSRLGGQFVALVRRRGRTFLLTDYFAAFQLFHDEGMTLFSTSLLAAAKAMPSLSFDPQGVYEFAFNVVPVGNDTVFRELKTVGPDMVIELRAEGAATHSVRKPLPDAEAKMPIEERIERQRFRLEAVVRPYAERFGDRVCCPLSGGLDSRLLLASLRAEGCRPDVYVYGPQDHPDVRIAREIAAAVGFEIEWVDKDAGEVEPDEFPELVERNFQEGDGLPPEGALFDNGADSAAREARHRGGALAVSGGCGEIYRNFFFLPDRPISAAAVARTFFARYDRRDTTVLFEEAGFLRAIEDKILAALGLSGVRERLPRPLVEQIYPRVRCRTFFGREISLEARYGAYLMPFLDHQVVAEAMTLPMELKHAGRFEAILLNAIDPVLARQPSAYGHHFAGPPGWKHGLDEWSTQVRPTWLRQRSYAIRRRLGKVADETGGLLSAEYLGRVLNLDYPFMRRFFRIDRIDDSGLRRRIACLEYLAQRLGSGLRN